MSPVVATLIKLGVRLVVFDERHLLAWHFERLREIVEHPHFAAELRRHRARKLFPRARKRLECRDQDAFELGVAVMLVGLGLRGLNLARHFAPTPEAQTHGHGSGSRLRPVFIGLVHGLAGSGALSAIVLAKASSALGGLAFLAVYGAGAALGMALLAGVAGVPLARLVRSPHGMPLLLGVTGVLCVGLGLGWGYPLLVRWL